MNILITGATGFIGRHLTKTLSSEYNITAVTRTPACVEGASRVVVIPDINGYTDWSSILLEIDVVIHLAARVHVMHENAVNPMKTYMDVNAIGSEVLARQSSIQGVKRFIYFSTVKVNGELTNGIPFKETDPPCPSDVYSWSKLIGERFVQNVGVNSSMEVICMRLPVVYGPGVKGNIQRLASLVARRVPLPFASVHNSRTMLSIENLEKWVTRALLITDIPTASILIGDPRPVSTAELIIQLARGMSLEPRLWPIPTGVLDLAGRLLHHRNDMSRLLGDLEILPTKTLGADILSFLEDPVECIQRVGGSFVSSR